MNKPSDYVFIEKWGRDQGSHHYYIREQQEQAAEDNAPLNATFKTVRSDKPWYTTDDITDNKKRLRFGLEPFTAETIPMHYLEEMYSRSDKRLTDAQTEYDRLREVVMRRRAAQEVKCTTS